MSKRKRRVRRTAALRGRRELHRRSLVNVVHETTDRYALANGAIMLVRLATMRDLDRIVVAHTEESEHAPEGGGVSPRHMLAYQRLKTMLHLRGPGAGVMTGWVGDELAGFVFFYADQAALKRSALSVRTVLWGLGQVLCGRFGPPWAWAPFVGFALQHFRPPDKYRSAAPEDGLHEPPPRYKAWIGTTHTALGFRRMGVASRLLSSVEEVLSRHGADAVALWVAEGNEPAINTYAKCGYSSITKVPRIGENCLLMAKQLGAEPSTTDDAGAQSR